MEIWVFPLTITMHAETHKVHTYTRMNNCKFVAVTAAT